MNGGVNQLSKVMLREMLFFSIKGNTTVVKVCPACRFQLA